MKTIIALALIGFVVAGCGEAAPKTVILDVTGMH
jgi:hypothetical protein